MRVQLTRRAALRRRIVRFAGLWPALAAVLVGSLAVSSPAAAATTSTTYKRFFQVTDETYLADIRRCVSVTSSGYITFRTKNVNSYEGVYISRKLTEPRLVVRTYNTCAQSRVPARFRTLVQTQRWYTSRCSSTMSVSAQVPWGVAVTPVYGCTRVRAAYRTPPAFGPATYSDEYNSRTTVSFADQSHTVRWTRSPSTGRVTYYDLCMRTHVELYVQISATTSDSWSPHMKACVRP